MDAGRNTYAHDVGRVPGNSSNQHRQNREEARLGDRDGGFYDHQDLAEQERLGTSHGRNNMVVRNGDEPP